MSHYDAFISDTEELLSQVYSIYLQFYKTKQEFVKNREAFLGVLGEKKGSELQEVVNHEKEKEKEKEENEDNKSVVEFENESEKIGIENNKSESTNQINSSPIYHKIALATHPDKHPECNPIFFQQAQKANEQRKLAKLVFLSRFLRIDIVPHFTQEEICELQKSVEKKKKKIEHYKKTYPWMYANADTEELRKKLLEAFCKVNAT
jgi:hypothetical protein